MLLIRAFDFAVVADLERAFSVELLFYPSLGQFVEVGLVSAIIVIATMGKMAGAYFAHSRNHAGTAV